MTGDDEIRCLGTILGIWAHPDDETYLSAGLMAAAADNGQRVVVVSATAGEHGTDDPVTWPPERLGPVRAREAAAALAALGVQEHRWMGLPDGDLRRCCPDEQIRRLAETIIEVAPDTILTFGPDGITGHQDHQVLGRWASAAHRLARPGACLLHAALEEAYCKRFQPLHDRFEVFMDGAQPEPRHHDELAVHLRLSGAELDRKLVALRAQATQTAPIIEAIGADNYARWVAEEAFVEVLADRS
ncbi:PIG-L deacetylase family protein [Rhabdothermincola salaria]|uniref:PIG-L deacetylase family protein n=1 Tax=Rhabdothermincola salaria TaxID=2903142 RepID=UPI001E3B47B4|nr:PIG-L family deacetylase [Rhabdothermincola salaria]MCD9625678.1 PIG-L family deacetylase [Rhabdothermincola salaria]